MNQKNGTVLLSRFYMYLIKFLMTRSGIVAVLLSMSVFFMLFFITCKHGDNMRPRGVPQCCKVEVYDDEGTEEYEKEYMDHVRYLYPAYEIDIFPEKVRVPEEQTRNNLHRYESGHYHEIRDLLHRVEFILRRRMMGVLISDHYTPPIELRLKQSLPGKLYGVV
jgi:hypothetical protein